MMKDLKLELMIIDFLHFLSISKTHLLKIKVINIYQTVQKRWLDGIKRKTLIYWPVFEVINQMMLI